MRLTNRFLRVLLYAALGTSVSLSGCKDYDDDIEALDGRVDALEKSLAELTKDFGELAYVKEVKFANGKLTIVDHAGKETVYDIPDTDTNTTYSLETSIADGKLVITLKGSDGSESKKEVELPEAEVFNPSNLRVDAATNKVMYGEVETGIVMPEIPEIPGFSAAAIKNSTGAIIGYTLTYGDESSTLILAGEQLQSLVFIPGLYYGGIEAMSANAIEYKPWTVKTLDIDGDDTKNEPEQAATYQSVVPTLEASYHVNPSNVREETFAVENMKFLAKNVAYSKAGEPFATEINNHTYDKGEGILTVTANLTGDIADLTADNKVSVLALQVGTKDTVVVSDYAAVRKVAKKDIVLSRINTVDPKACDPTLHLPTTIAAAIAGDALFEIEWNNNEGMDIAKLIQAHLGSCEIWDGNAADGKVKGYGFKYEYGLVGYTSGANATSQSAHAALKGSIIRAQATLDGKHQEFGYTQSKATIGRMPLVRVILKDTIANKVAAVGFVKFEIVEDAAAPSEDTFKAFGPYNETENYTVSCASEDFVFDLDWFEVEEDIYTALKMSKEEFEAAYELDGFVANTTPATQFTTADLKAQPVAAAIGKVEISTADNEGNQTEVLRWTLTQADAYKLFVTDKKTNAQAIVRFKLKAAAGAQSYAYVTFTWNPAELNVAPKAIISDDSKIAEYWYAQASGEAGKHEVHAHVAVPDGTITDASGCTYEKDLLDFFVGKKIGYDVVDAETYENFKNLTLTLKFVEPREKEATGVDGTKYTLGVSADGLHLTATAKDGLPENIVELDGTKVILDENNATVKNLLNYAGRNELEDGKTLAAKIGIFAENNCQQPAALENNTFEVRFIRPISVDDKANDGLTDGLDGGDEIALSEFISFTDWRNYDFTTENNYFVYYGVTAVTINTDEITTNLNGKDIEEDKLTDVAPGIVVEFEAAQQLSLTDMGKLTYKNNGGELREAFKIRVPVTVEYKWGKVVKHMDITIHPTVGK